MATYRSRRSSSISADVPVPRSEGRQPSTPADLSTSVPMTQKGPLVSLCPEGCLIAASGKRTQSGIQSELGQQLLPTLGSFESGIPHVGRGERFCFEGSRQRCCDIIGIGRGIIVRRLGNLIDLDRS